MGVLSKARRNGRLLMGLLLVAAFLVGGVALKGAWAASEKDLFKQGRASLLEHSYRPALQAFEQLMKEYPKSSYRDEVSYYIPLCHFKLQQYDKAKEALEGFLKGAAPSIWRARSCRLLAQLYHDTDRWSQRLAIAELFERAIVDLKKMGTPEARKEVIEILFLRAGFLAEYYYYDDMKKWSALDDYRQIISLAKDTVDEAKARLALAGYYYQRHGEKKEYLSLALTELRTVVKLFPKSPFAEKAQFTLGSILESQSRFVEALDEYRLVLKHYPKSELAKQAKEKIAEILEPRLSTYISQVYHAKKDPVMNLSTRNIGKISFTAYRIDLLDFFRKVKNLTDYERYPLKECPTVKTWEYDTGDKGEHLWAAKELPVPVKERGAYLVVATGANKKTTNMLLVSNLSLVTKWASGKLLAYCAEGDTGKPVTDAQIAIATKYSTDNTDSTPYEKRYYYFHSIDEGKTDDAGMLTRDLAGWKDYEQAFIVAKRSDDYAVSQGYSYYSRWQDRTVAYFYTDRPVYRPGNEVSFKGIVRFKRDGAWQPGNENKVKVFIRDARGNAILEQEVATNGFGTFSGKVKLGEEPPLGAYSVQVQYEGSHIGSYNFRVEEYKKPEYVVTVSTDRPFYRRGDEMKVTVSGKYYFGEPVEGAKVSITVKRSGDYHHYSQWNEGEDLWNDEGDEDNYSPNRYRYREHYDEAVLQKEGVLDGKGAIAFTVPTARKVSESTDEPDDYRYTIVANVIDKSRREIHGSGSAKVVQKTTYFFLNAARYVYTLGDKVKIHVRSEDPLGKGVAVKAKATIYKALYNSQRGEYDFTPLQEMPVAVDESGTTAIEYTADLAGYFKVVMKGLDGHEDAISGETWVWIASEEYRGGMYKYGGVEVLTDKQVYRKGETAKVLVNAPFDDSYFLFTVETREIHHARIIKAKGRTTLVEIPITQDYVPNVWFNVSAVRNYSLHQQSREIFVPPYDKFMKIKVTQSKETYRPGEKGTFTVETADEDGNPLAAEVSLGVVDAAVYYIQEETAPAIKKFFYGDKRQHYINTHYSYDFQFQGKEEKYAQSADRASTGAMPASPAAEAAPGGAPRMKAAKANGGKENGDDEAPVEIRRNFADTALWLAHVVTGKDGKATVEVTFPDSLTTWRTTARAVTRDTKVGSSVTEVITKKSFFVRYEGPRFFTQRDKVTLSAIVHNYLKTEKTGRVVLEAEGLTVLGESEKKVNVPKDGNVRVDFTVLCENAGRAKILLKALSDEESDGVELFFDVIPHGAEKYIAASGEVKNTTEREVDVPAERRLDTTSLAITLSPSLASALNDSLEYLAQYPYGCVEQTMSRFLPAAIVGRTLKDLGIRNEKLEKELPKMIAAGLKRLYDFQHGDGGWGWWKNDTTNDYMTAYVMYGLTLAKSAGYDIDGSVLSRGREFLKGRLKSHLDDKDLNTLNFMLYALSFSNEAPKKYVDIVYENRDDLNDYMRALLAMTLHNTREVTKAKVMLRNMLDFVREDKENDTASWARDGHWWWWWQDGVEATSMSLQAFVNIDPKSEIVPKVVRWLVYNRKGNRWKSTKDTAFAVLALTEYLKKSGELDTDMEYTVAVNDRLFKGHFTGKNLFDPANTILLKGDDVPSGNVKIRLTRKGKGHLYYAVGLTYYTLEEGIKGAGNEIFVTRSYSRLVEKKENNRLVYDRRPIKDGDTLKSGDLVEVKLSIKAKNNYEYLVFEDMKPAGCEPVELQSGSTYAGGFCANMELRDEKVVFFVTLLHQGTHEVAYKVKAEVPGQFHAMPTNSYAMYAPEVRSISDEFRMNIED